MVKSYNELQKFLVEHYNNDSSFNVMFRTNDGNTLTLQSGSGKFVKKEDGGITIKIDIVSNTIIGETTLSMISDVTECFENAAFQVLTMLDVSAKGWFVVEDNTIYSINDYLFDMISHLMKDRNEKVIVINRYLTELTIKDQSIFVKKMSVKLSETDRIVSESEIRVTGLNIRQICKEIMKEATK